MTEVDARAAAASEDPGTAETRDPDDLRPREIVRHLDAYIVGQDPAKRSVAVALRNRVRRRRLTEEMRREVLPKNILMIGPTGVGKTEIARRLAKLTSCPFIKVEATKFTEVGYVGRDVEAIVRDLLEQTITEVHDERIDEVEERARELAESRILDILVEAEIAADPAANGSSGADGHPGQHGSAADAEAVAPPANGKTVVSVAADPTDEPTGAGSPNTAWMSAWARGPRSSAWTPASGRQRGPSAQSPATRTNGTG